MDQQELRRLARIGAAARLEQLDRERAVLLRSFPGLRAATTSSDADEDRVAPGTPAKRQRRNMSAARRKAVSVRMKRYWAERRKAKGGKPAKA